MDIAPGSNVTIEIDADSVPAHDGLDWRRAMSDGEDYELCFTATGAVPDRINDVPITPIGRVVARNDASDSPVVVRFGSETFDASQLGWEHR